MIGQPFHISSLFPIATIFDTIYYLPSYKVMLGNLFTNHHVFAILAQNNLLSHFIRQLVKHSLVQHNLLIKYMIYMAIYVVMQFIGLPTRSKLLLNLSTTQSSGEVRMQYVIMVRAKKKFQSQRMDLDQGSDSSLVIKIDRIYKFRRCTCMYYFYYIVLYFLRSIKEIK